MTQEEKARAYDRVSKEVKDFFEGRRKMYSDVNKTLEYLFPELVESKDEKIRKAIISGMTALKDQGKETFARVPINDCIAWLEKQGDQKYTQKDVDNAYLKGVSTAKRMFEKQGEQEKDILEDAILDGNEDGLIAETIRYKHENQAEQKSAWNKEDKGIIEEVVSYLINYSNIVESKEDADRIEYLIDKIQDICPHQKQEWSEEDEQHIDSLLKRLDALCRNKFERTRFAISEDIDWLKSLRPQNRWKPSDEQMEALDWQVENTSVSSWQYKATRELMEDLKKLKEE